MSAWTWLICTQSNVSCLPHNGSSFPCCFAIPFLTVSICSMRACPQDRSAQIDVFRAISSVLVSNFKTQTICIWRAACQRRLLCPTDCMGWIRNIPIQNAKPTRTLPQTTAAFPQDPLPFPGVVKLGISTVQYRHTTRLKPRSSLNFSFLLLAFLVLGSETRSLMAQFYGLEIKVLKSLTPALNESRFAVAQNKPSA